MHRSYTSYERTTSHLTHLCHTELEGELERLRGSRAELYEKYETEKSESSQLIEVQEQIDR